VRLLVASVVVCTPGCRSILGVDDPTVEMRLDASPEDAAIDAPPDARVCPIAPAGCTAFACAGHASCYYHCANPARVWGDAQQRCTELPMGCLVTIDDAAENACIAVRAAGASRWIGYQQPNTNVEPGGGWGWKCGVSSYAAQWGNGEPNDFTADEDCAEIYASGRWNDEACTATRGYICEVP
jgi:hypothetical protein